MSITTYPLDCGDLHILDLDADEHGNFMALMSNMEVWTNWWQLPLKQEYSFPIIRKLNKTQFLLVEARHGITADSGHIFNLDGVELLSFNAGECIEDVLIQAGRIVVSYFDQAASKPSPSSEGIAVFDFTGHQAFGFNSSHYGFILDCYAMCKLGKDSILAYTYTGFPLFEIRLTDYHLSKQPAPDDFKGAHALTSDRDNAVFYSSYEDKTGFFWWNRKQKGMVQRFGNYVQTGRIRGIGNGKFLTYDANSFSILDAMEMMREERHHRNN